MPVPISGDKIQLWPVAEAVRMPKSCSTRPANKYRLPGDAVMPAGNTGKVGTLGKLNDGKMFKRLLIGDPTPTRSTKTPGPERENPLLLPFRLEKPPCISANQNALPANLPV